ncbi:Endothelial cell-selective adhesion molecule, partial [Galemys pyrenaicus]
NWRPPPAAVLGRILRLDQGASPLCSGPSFLFPAVPSQAQLQLHVPVGLTKLQVVEGADVVLPTWYTLQVREASSQPWEMLSAIWFLQQKGKDQEQVLAYIRGVTISNPGVSLVYSMPSQNVSLRLQGLQEKDSGSYYCSVNVQDSQGKHQGHNNSQSLELSVLVPPAPPSCRVLGVPRVGTNVTLSCWSPRNKPIAQYQWERSPPSSQVFFAPVLENRPWHAKKDIPDAFRKLGGGEGRNRVPGLTAKLCPPGVFKPYKPFHFHVRSLYLQSPQYCGECPVQCDPGSDHRSVRGPGTAVVAGAVVGTLLGLGLLVGLVLLYQRHRGKALEERANDIKEDAVAPRTLPWPKGSDTISKNGTLSSVTSARALRPPQGPPRPGALTPTASLSSQVLPSPGPTRTDGAHPRPITLSPGGFSSAALTRMGGVPVMVPAQSQAGSLV